MKTVIKSIVTTSTLCLALGACGAPQEAPLGGEAEMNVGQSTHAVNIPCMNYFEDQVDWIKEGPANDEERWYEARVATNFQSGSATYSEIELRHYQASGFFPERLAYASGYEGKHYFNTSRYGTEKHPFDPAKARKLGLVFWANGSMTFRWTEGASTFNIWVNNPKCDHNLIYGFGDDNAPLTLFTVALQPRSMGIIR